MFKPAIIKIILTCVISRSFYYPLKSWTWRCLRSLNASCYDFFLQAFNPAESFEDDPSMTKKQFLTRRLKWWLANDRLRALSTNYNFCSPVDLEGSFVETQCLFSNISSPNSLSSEDVSSVSRPGANVVCGILLCA